LLLEQPIESANLDRKNCTDLNPKRENKMKPIPWKLKKALVNCPHWKKDAELFISLCILISYGEDHLPDDFRLPMDIPLAADFTIKKGSRITPFILDAIKSRIPRWIQEIKDAEKANTRS